MGDMPVRLVSPEQMHVTLMFYPSVSSEKRDELVDLIRQVEWVPINANAVRLVTLRRNAVAIELGVSTDELEGFEDRLGRSIFRGRERFEYLKNLNSQPLAQLAFAQDQPELEKLRRRNAVQRPLQLHVTIGRAGKTWTLSKHALDTPSIDIVLARIALYESVTRPEGAVNHEIAAPI